MDNTVEVVIKGRDEVGPAFAGAEARAKSFQRVMDETTRKEIGAHKAVSEAETAHLKTLRLLADTEKVLGDNSERSRGHLSRLAGVFGSLGDAIAPALRGIPLVGSGLASIASAGPAGLAVLAGMAVALAAIAVVIGPLVAGLAAITLGIGAFAAAALIDLPKAKKEIKGFKDEFAKLADAVKPQVFKALGTALDILKTAMPAITPLAVAAGKALDKFLGRIDDWLKSASGKKFLAWLANDGPKAIDTFGNALWRIVNVVGQVLFWWDKLGNGMVKAFAPNAAAILHAAQVIIGALQGITDVVLTMVGAFVNGMAKAFGWVPVVGAKLKQSAADFNGWKNGVDAVFNHAKGTLASWQSNMEKLPKIVKLQGNIIDLQSKLATANRELANPNLTKTRRAKLQAEIAQLLGAIARAKAAIASVHGKTVTISVITTKSTVYSPNNPLLSGKTKTLATGGIVGAAADGGVHSGMTWVGEEGPELVSLPMGSTVYPAGQSKAMASHGGGGQTIRLELTGGQSAFDQFMIRWFKENVRVRGGGNVQTAFGSKGR